MRPAPFIAVLSLPLMLAMASAFASAPTAPRIDVRVERSGDALVIVASAQLHADASTAWDVLTDYARYRNFMPGVHASRVVSRHGTSVVVEQSDEVPLWFWRVAVRVIYDIDESPPARVHSYAHAPSWPPLDSTFLLDRTESGLRLDYRGRVGPGMPVLARLEQPMIEHAIVRDLQALATEIERKSAAGRAGN
jgi:hypothetical protein